MQRIVILGALILSSSVYGQQTEYQVFKDVRAYSYKKSIPFEKLITNNQAGGRVRFNFIKKLDDEQKEFTLNDFCTMKLKHSIDTIDNTLSLLGSSLAFSADEIETYSIALEEVASYKFKLHGFNSISGWFHARTDKKSLYKRIPGYRINFSSHGIIESMTCRFMDGVAKDDYLSPDYKVLNGYVSAGEGLVWVIHSKNERFDPYGTGAYEYANFDYNEFDQIDAARSLGNSGVLFLNIKNPKY